VLKDVLVNVEVNDYFCFQNKGQRLDLDRRSGRAIMENAGYCVTVLLFVNNVFQAITGLLGELMQIVGKKYH
jgi:hypothetical protein